MDIPELWAGQVSNLRRLAPTILQTASFNHSDTDPEFFRKAGDRTRTRDPLFTKQPLYH
jgi:hypothetical protein